MALSRLELGSLDMLPRHSERSEVRHTGTGAPFSRPSHMCGHMIGRAGALAQVKWHKHKYRVVKQNGTITCKRLTTILDHLK